MADAPKTMDGHDWALLLLLSMLWGGAFFFSGVAVVELPPLTLAFLRVGLAALALAPLLLLQGHRLPRRPGEWLPFAGMGLLNNALPFSLIFAGQTFVTIGMASIVNALTPLFTILVLAAFRDERLTVYRLIGVLLGLLGVAVLRGMDEPLAGTQTLGVMLCMGGALSYGFSALWGRRMLGGVAPVKSATCQLICSTVLLAPLAAAVDRPWSLPAPGATTLWAVAALALFGTALAYLAFFRIMARAGAGNVMLVTLLIPVTAMLLAWGLLGEPILSQDVAGAAIIGLGLLFIDGRLPDLARCGWTLRS